MAEESSLDIDVEKMPTDTISPDLEEIPGYSEVVERAGEFFSLGERYEWMIEVFAILMLTAVFSFVAGMVLRIITKAMTKTQSEWDDIFVESVRVPLKMVIWIVGVFYAIEAAYSAENSEVMLLLSNGRDVAIVFMFAWAMTRYINAGMDYYIKRQKRRGKNYDYTAVNAITKLLKIAVALSAFLIGLQSLGVSVSGVLAAGGIGGIAIGFAAKDMLANFFGAFIIYFDKPFKVGDWIRSPDQEIEGTVEDIGWRITTIRTFDMRPLYVPNSVFSNISVENPSRMTHRRIYETVGIRYDDMGVMALVVEDVKAMLEKHEEIDNDKTMIVNFNAFNSSSCDFFVYTFTHTTNWVKFHSVKQDVLLKIAEIIDNHGADIAYPTQVEYSYQRDMDAVAEREERRKESEAKAKSKTQEDAPKSQNGPHKGGKRGPDADHGDAEGDG